MLCRECVGHELSLYAWFAMFGVLYSFARAFGALIFERSSINTGGALLATRSITEGASAWHWVSQLFGSDGGY